MGKASRWAAVALAVATWSSIGCGEDADPPHSRTTRPWGAPSNPEPPPDAAGNSAPRIEAVRFEPARPRAGEPVRAQVEASDPDGDPLRFGYVWTLNGESLPESGPRASLAGTRKGDSVEVTVTASDGRAESGPFAASTRVRNRTPVLRGLRVDPPARITAGEEVSARPAADDPDGDRIAFRFTWWVNGEVVEESGPVLSTRGLQRGDTVRVQAVATDGEEDSQPVQSPEITVGNSPPVIVSTPGAAGEDGVFRYQVRAEDPDRDAALRFHLKVAPEGMTVKPASGEIEWVPRSDQAGVHPVEVVVEDLRGAQASQRFEVSVGGAGEEVGATPPAARGR